MKALIISDSHGLKEELFEVLLKYQNDVDIMIHCGDSELSKQSFGAFDHLYTVRGNCDYDNSFENEVIVTINGIKILVVHGHRHNVKNSAVNLSYYAEEVKAKLVCFGHSHVALSFMENNVLYVNPGSFHLPRRRVERSYAIITFKKDLAIVQFYDHEGNEILDLKESYTML